jgi:signal transduction histidine kinase
VDTSNLPKAEATPPAVRKRSAWLAPAAVSLLVVIIFGAAQFLVSYHLRQKIREQILGRDSEVLKAVALMRQYSSEPIRGRMPEDSLAQLEVVLETSKLKDVLAVRLYELDGAFRTAFPEDAVEGRLSPEDLAAVRRQTCVSRLLTRLPYNQVFTSPEASTKSLVEVLQVIIPIGQRDNQTFSGIAEFFINGQPVSQEFQRLDQSMLRHGLGVFSAGGVVILGGLWWAFRRLHRANQLLAERTASLTRANQELILAAKTSAIGSVTAHLIHGLRNPLSALMNFVSSENREGASGDWQHAIDSTRRMHTLVNEVVRILREDTRLAGYEINLDEIMELISARIQPLARVRGVIWEAHGEGQAVLRNREANLVLLILENLSQNAVEATPVGCPVLLRGRGDNVELRFEVCDSGPGLSSAVQASLFSPLPSTKAGGSGLGLAISSRLAAQIGAVLALKQSSEAGCVFTLTLPLNQPAAPADQEK